jgi:choline monooxygenase
MSDIGNHNNLLPPKSQFPVEWYFDQERFDREKKLIFDAGPGYVGHALMAPELHDFRTQEWHDHGRMISHQPDGHYEISNVCRHRQAIMLEGQGNARTIVCPIHRWTYDSAGALLGAPHFAAKPCLNLPKTRLENWQGLLFKGPRSAADDLAGLAVSGQLDFSGYRLNRVEQHLCNYNWKTFIEVYLEDYHVEPFHPGLNSLVNCDELTWQFGEWYSVQRVGARSLAKSGSPTYARWHQALLDYSNGLAPEHGAIWLTYFPNVMIEWYPHALIVSRLIPQAVDKTLHVVEFYYPEEIALFEPELIEAEQAAYLETAAEDDIIGERMDRGRRALLTQGRSEVGPYQSPMEDGMQHFHEFYRRVMGEGGGS